MQPPKGLSLTANAFTTVVNSHPGKITFSSKSGTMEILYSLFEFLFLTPCCDLKCFDTKTCILVSYSFLSYINIIV